MLNNIPKELRELPQWVCATPEKVPVNPINGFNASPVNSNSWTTFDKASKAACEKYPHISFMLSADDPYTIIDLDDPYSPKKDWTDEERQKFADLNQSIVDSFESYTEISQSGTGIHIIVKGSIPKGVNRDTVEMYSTQRHMITTGNVFKDLPIVDCQDILDQMYSQMKAESSSVDLVDVADTNSDNDLFEQAVNAANGEKFVELCQSTPDGIQNSEMDLALLSIIAFYTESNEQARRMFRSTNRGKRDKVNKNDKYLDYTLQKIRANQIQPVDLDAAKKMAQNLLKNMVKKKDKKIEEQIKPVKAPEPVPDDYSSDDFPPGLVGRVASYIYESAARPVPAIGLVAALGYLAGMIGQRYNVSGVGLNQYLILLAKTGTGKEGIASGIDRLNNKIRKVVPGVESFRGPSAFASGPALVKMMAEKPVFLSILGEFGLTLQALCDPKSNGAQVTLRQALLDLYQKSGKDSVLRASVYSDKEKNTDDVDCPALTLLGESTPETFYEGLSEHHISDGLIPRFTIFEHHGKRPYFNKDHGAAPTEELVDDLVELVSTVLTMMANHQFVDVDLTPEVAILSDDYERRTTDIINDSANPALCQLWNRAHLKLLKLAALVAVGIDQHNPTIDKACFEWAQSFVEKDIESLMKRFEKGDIGSGESKQYQDMMRKIAVYYRNKATPEYKKFHSQSVFPMKYITRATYNLSSFKKDGRGQGRVRDDLLRQLIDEGMIVQFPPMEAKKLFGTSAKVFALGDSWQFSD